MIIKWYLTKTLHTKKCLDNAWIVLRISNQSDGLVSYKRGGGGGGGGGLINGTIFFVIGQMGL